jgi:uncharacterized membrane protein YedE/YeeE
VGEQFGGQLGAMIKGRVTWRGLAIGRLVGLGLIFILLWRGCPCGLGSRRLILLDAALTAILFYLVIIPV